MYRLSSFGLSSFVLRKFFFFLSSSVCLTVHVLFCFVVFLSVFLSPSTTPVHVGFAPMHLSFMSLVLSFSVCPPLTFSVLSFCLIFTHPVQSSVISYWPVLLLFCPLPNSSVTKEIMMEFFQDFRPFLLLCLLASVGPFFLLCPLRIYCLFFHTVSFSFILSFSFLFSSIRPYLCCVCLSFVSLLLTFPHLFCSLLSLPTLMCLPLSWLVLSSSIFFCLVLISSPQLYCVSCSLTAQRRHQSSRTLRLSTCTLFTSPKRQAALLEPPVSEEGSGGSAWDEHKHNLMMTAEHIQDKLIISRCTSAHRCRLNLMLSLSGHMSTSLQSEGILFMLTQTHIL